MAMIQVIEFLTFRVIKRSSKLSEKYFLLVTVAIRPTVLSRSKKKNDNSGLFVNEPLIFSLSVKVLQVSLQTNSLF